MNTEEILTILRSSHEINIDKGIEEDDLLANKFISLEGALIRPFWSSFANAMETLNVNHEVFPFYLAARFMYSMSIALPPRKPAKKSLFNFILNQDFAEIDPLQHAGALLTLLVLEKGDAVFWMNQIDISLSHLKNNENVHRMDAVVYAFIGLNRVGDISADHWAKLFTALAYVNELPEMEVLELLVSVEKENTRTQRLSIELDLGLDTFRTSTESNRILGFKNSLNDVFQTWLDFNEPRPYISTWLQKQLSNKNQYTRSPRQFYLQQVNNSEVELAAA